MAASLEGGEADPKGPRTLPAPAAGGPAVVAAPNPVAPVAAVPAVADAGRCCPSRPGCRSPSSRSCRNPSRPSCTSPRSRSCRSSSRASCPTPARCNPSPSAGPTNCTQLQGKKGRGGLSGGAHVPQGEWPTARPVIKFNREEEGAYINSSAKVWFGGGVLEHSAAAGPGAPSHREDRSSPPQWFREEKNWRCSFPAVNRNMQATWWECHASARNVPAEGAPRIPSRILPSCQPPLPPANTLCQKNAPHDEGAVVKKPHVWQCEIGLALQQLTKQRVWGWFDTTGFSADIRCFK